MLIITLLTSCDKDPEVSENASPETFELISPTDSSTSVSLSPTLIWETADDADGDKVVYDDKLWIIGGLVDGELRSDVWFSNNGYDWGRATHEATFGNRTHHASIVYDNKIWLIAGDDKVDTYNDMWFTEDGVNWTLSRKHANFRKRTKFQAQVYEDKIWVFGGAEDTDNRKVLGDVW